MHLLKQLCEPCGEPIAIIVNMSLEMGIVSDHETGEGYSHTYIPIHKHKAKS